MPDGPTWDELNEQRKELEARRDELMQESSAVEQVTQTNAAVKELRAMLDATGEDAGAVKEKLGEYLGKLKGLDGEIKNAIEGSPIEELSEGVGDGLGEFTDALEAVDGAIEPLENALDTLQDALEKSQEPAQQQIEALAEAFEQVVDKLGPLIERIPGLGAFFRIYAEAIRAIAGSVGQIQATQRSLQRAWGQLRPGTTMYLHPRNEHEINAQAVRDIQLEIDRIVEQMNEIAREEREAIPESGPHEVDVLVRTAENRCANLRPPTNAPELKARNDAWRALEEAEGRRSAAQSNYEAAADEAERAAIALEAATSIGRQGSADLDTLRAQAGSADRARERALNTLREREADFDRSRAAFEQAKAPWDAMQQRYIDCVKEQIGSLGSFANETRGLSEGDRRYLDVMYPEYRGAGSPPAAAPTEVSAVPKPGAGRRRLIMMGGGGLLAMAMVAVVLILPGGGDDAPAAGGSGSSGAAAASSSTPASSGSSSTGAPAPVIVHPCDVFTAGEVSAMFGRSLGSERTLDGDRRAVCTFLQEGDAGGIHVEVQRNSSSAGFLEEFRRQRPDASVIPVEWSDEGEIRVTSNSDGPTTSLWAYVITTDYLGRDVFIWIAGTTGGNVEAVTIMGERLRDAVLEAQP